MGGPENGKKVKIYSEAAYDFLKNIDLVEKHALLVLVHMALAENLHCTLGAGLAMHTHSNFTKSAYVVLQTISDQEETQATYPFPKSFQFCNSL